MLGGLELLYVTSDKCLALLGDLHFLACTIQRCVQRAVTKFGFEKHNTTVMYRSERLKTVVPER